MILKYIKDRTPEDKKKELEITKEKLLYANNSFPKPITMVENKTVNLPPEPDNTEVIEKIKAFENKINDLQNQIEQPGISSAKMYLYINI